MSSKKRALIGLALCAMLVAGTALPITTQAQGTVLDPDSAEEALVLDPQTGNYILTYKTFTSAGRDILFRMEFIPATKIKPRIRSKFKESKEDTIFYRYKIKNRKNAEQALISLRMITSDTDETSQMTPEGWDGIIVRNMDEAMTRVNWHFERGGDVSTGLAPGAQQDGFTFESRDLPGVGIARLRGATPTLTFAGEGPQGEIGDAFHELDLNDFVALLAAMPLIRVPDPFDAAIVLEEIQNHVQELIGLELVEPVVAGQFDTLFTAATEALGRNDSESTLSHLKDLRHLIQQARDENEDDDKKHKGKNKKKGKHDDDDWDDGDEKAGRDRQITRLAARVLLFDVRFVAERLREELKNKKRSAKAS